MSLNLDKRQRAMLLEMGVHVWLPEALVPVQAQAQTVAAGAGMGAGMGMGAGAAGAGAASAAGHPTSMPASSQPQTQAPARPVAPAGFQRETPPPAPTSTRSASQPAAGSGSTRPQAQGGMPAAWLLGAAQILYADTTQADGAQTAGTRWLVLAETPPTALPGGVLADFSAFEGEAGKLLENMLRAAQLDRAGAALLAPLVRQGAAAATPEFVAELAALVAQTQPDIVLIMGRFASLSLLPTGEPFGKLRGHAHTLHGAHAIVTYDAPYLLRKPEDKAKAWADLCLAMSLTAAR